MVQIKVPVSRSRYLLLQQYKRFFHATWSDLLEKGVVCLHRQVLDAIGDAFNAVGFQLARAISSLEHATEPEEQIYYNNIINTLREIEQLLAEARDKARNLEPPCDELTTAYDKAKTYELPIAEQILTITRMLNC